MRISCGRSSRPSDTEVYYDATRHRSPFHRLVSRGNRLQRKACCNLKARPAILEGCVQCKGRSQFGVRWKVVASQEEEAYIFENEWPERDSRRRVPGGVRRDRAAQHE